MKKKILVFLCVLTLSLNSYAESIDQSPPPLPVLEKTTKSVNDRESFWGKILEFFSFNDAKKNVLQPAIIPAIIESSSNKANTGDEQTLKPTNITNQLASNNVIPANSSKTETVNEPELPRSPDIADLKLPDGLAPDEELTKKKDENSGTISTDTTSANNVVVNNQELNKQPDPTTEPKTDAIDLKLPDGLAPDEELPKKKDENSGTISTDTTSANNVAVNNQELNKQPDPTTEPKADTIDLKLPDGLAPDEELPKIKDENSGTISTDTTSANNVAVNNQELNKQPDPTTEPKADAIDLKLPDNVAPHEETVNKTDNSQDIKDSSKSQDTKLNTKLQTDITSTSPSNDLNVKKSDTTTQSREPVLTKNININIDKTIPLANKVTTDQITAKSPKTPKSIADSDAEKSKNIDNLNVKSYRQHLQEQLNKPKKLPEISKEDLNPDHTVEMDSAQLKFVNDEAQMLLLPSDEVVMGEVTTESQLDLMDLGSYLKIFWDNYNNIKEEPARQSINNFINNYDNNFHKLPSYSQEELADILIEAFKAIDKNSIYDLINLLDNYPILQLVDYKGNSLLHKSVYKNNYLAAKFLIMKGIDTSIRNNEGLTALDAAIIQKKTNIEILLKSAGANYGAT